MLLVVTVVVVMVILVAVVVLAVAAVVDCNFVTRAGERQMPRLTSSCCDIKSTCQSSWMSSGNNDVFTNSADTMHDTVTANTHNPCLTVGRSDREEQMCKNARRYGEKPGRPSGSGHGSADFSLMLPPESTV